MASNGSPRTVRLGAAEIRDADRDLRLYAVTLVVDGVPVGYVGIGGEGRAEESAGTRSAQLSNWGYRITSPAQVRFVDTPRLPGVKPWYVYRVAEAQAIVALGLLMPLLNTSSAARVPLTMLRRQVSAERVHRFGKTVIDEAVAAATDAFSPTLLSSVTPAARGATTGADRVAVKVVLDARVIGGGFRPIPTHQQMAEWLGTTSRGPDEWRRGRIQFGQLAGHAALTSTERTREEHGFALPRLEFARGEVAPAPWTLQVTG